MLHPSQDVTFSFNPKILIHTKTGRGKRQNQKDCKVQKTIGRRLAAACKTPIKTIA
jgi:hypothetical protein